MDTTAAALPLDMTMPASNSAPAPATRRLRRKPRVWTAFAVLFMAFIGGNVLSELIYGNVARYVYGAGAANGLEPAQIDEQWNAMLDGTFLGFVLSFVPLQVFIGFLSVLAALYSPVPFRERVGLVKPAMPKLGWPATVFAPLPDLVIGVIVATVVTIFVGAPASSGLPQVTNPSVPVAIAIVLLSSVLPAVFEEILFRGYFQRRLLERWSPVAAIGLSSLLFALVHSDSLQHICAVLPGGIFYGIVAYRTKSIWPTIVMHALHNAYIDGLGRLESAAAGASMVALVGMLSVLAAGVLLGLPGMMQLVFGRIPGSGIRTLAASVESVIAVELPADADAAGHPQPLLHPADGDSLRNPELAPLTTLSA